MVELSDIELRKPDYNKFVVLARSPRPAASLSEVTEGDLDRSLRQRELRRPCGFEDELRMVVSDTTGTCGAITLLREAKRPDFTVADAQFVASLSSTLADGLRHAALLGEALQERDDGDAGLLLLGPDNTVLMTNETAEVRLDELGGPARLPAAVRAVAARARAAATPGDDADRAGGAARARVRTSTGRWLTVRASLLGDDPAAPVAVVIDTTRPPELAPLIADAYGLTDRERRVTELVAQGFSTNEIAARLHLSAYTVQDHLKGIFDKTGTGSRGDLVARLFFDHYVPRLTESSNSC
jgi:DNA-binding CsgD family transcriptional regulator